MHNTYNTYSYTGYHQYAWPTYRPTSITNIDNIILEIIHIPYKTYYVPLGWAACWLQRSALLQAVIGDICTYEGTSGCSPFRFWPRPTYIGPCFTLALSARLGPPKMPQVEGDHYVKSWTRSYDTLISP